MKLDAYTTQQTLMSMSDLRISVTTLLTDQSWVRNYELRGSLEQGIRNRKLFKNR